MAELEELSQVMARINAAKNREELNAIIAEIMALPSDTKALVPHAIAAYGPLPEIRELGRESVGDVIGPVGTPPGNRFYVWGKIQGQ